MELNKLRLQPGEWISVEIDTELSVVITSKTDSLKISGPRNRLLKTAVVSTHGMVIPEDGDAEETPL